MEQKIGYKGTDKNMQCKNVQFELGKTYYIDDKNEVKELPDGYNIIKSNVKMCSKEAIHYCNELEQVFKHYTDNGLNRFFKVEILGEYKDEHGKSGCRCIKFLEEIGQDYLKARKKEKEEERLDETMHLPTVKSLQEENPNLIVGGSISLYLQGVRLSRFKGSDGIDYDFTLPYYQILKTKEGISIEEGEDKMSGSDYGESLYIDDVKADLRIDPKQKYELLEYKGFTYKIVPLITIIKAKAEYALTKWGQKHKDDIIEMILNK
jgi:hypothetical protein